MAEPDFPDEDLPTWVIEGVSEAAIQWAESEAARRELTLAEWIEEAIERALVAEKANHAHDADPAPQDMPPHLKKVPQGPSTGGSAPFPTPVRPGPPGTTPLDSNRIFQILRIFLGACYLHLHMRLL